MTEDFVTRLGLQLRDAAEREARRSAPARALRSRPAVPALALGAVVLVLAVAAAALWLRGDDAPPLPATPTVIAELELTPNPEQLIPAFGSIWIADPVAGTLVRVDPGSRAVLARIPVGSAPFIDPQPVGDELWAVNSDSGRLTRIDPRTNRVLARSALRTPAGRSFAAVGLLASGDVAWAVSGQGALRLDPATGTGVRLADTPSESAVLRTHGHGAVGAGQSTTASTAWTRGPVRPREACPPASPAQRGVTSAGDDLFVFKRPDEAARLDGRTGAAIWHRDLGGTAGAGDVTADVFWSHLSVAGQRDRLVRLDPATGETLATVPLDSFGASGVLAIDGEIWLNTPAGPTYVLGQDTR